MSARTLPLKRGVLIGACAGSIFVAALSVAHAQGSGGGREPSVEVNNSVIDSLAPSDSGHGAQAPALHYGTIKLHPPGHTAKAAPRVSRTKAPVRTKPSKATVVAAKPAEAAPAAPVAAVADPAPAASPAVAPRAAEPATATAPIAAPASEQAAPAAAPAPVASNATSAPAAASPPAASPPQAAAAVTSAEPAKPSAQAALAPVLATPAAEPAALKPAPTALVPARLSASSALPARVLFQPNATDLPDQAKGMLDGIAKKLQGDEQLRVQLVAYAGGLPDQANQARRLSLSRAVTIRAYLIEHGVRSTRIDVRALGNRPESGGAPDRVDIVALER